MYCCICSKLSLYIICNKCLNKLSHIESKRILANGLKVFSTFSFSELKMLVSSKNNIIGSRVFTRLGVYGVKKFFDYNKEILNVDKKYIAVVCVRNNLIGAYSHSAILAKCFKKYGFNVFYNSLIIGNNSHFSLLNKQQRQNIGRNFHFKIKSTFKGIIIIDDIITTGQTLLEASEAIKQNNNIPLFSWTLCDSRF